MVRLEPVDVGGRQVTGITVDLPGTRLTILATRRGYLMCGALDVGLLDARLGDRRIVAGRALGVRTIQDLLDRPLDAVTEEARRLGLRPGMRGRDALRILLEHEEGSAPGGAGGTDGG